MTNHYQLLKTRRMDNEGETVLWGPYSWQKYCADSIEWERVIYYRFIFKSLFDKTTAVR